MLCVFYQIKKFFVSHNQSQKRAIKSRISSFTGFFHQSSRFFSSFYSYRVGNQGSYCRREKIQIQNGGGKEEICFILSKLVDQYKCTVLQIISIKYNSGQKSSTQLQKLQTHDLSCFICKAIPCYLMHSPDIKLLHL